MVRVDPWCRVAPRSTRFRAFVGRLQGCYYGFVSGSGSEVLTEEQREFLQFRVARFGFVAGGVILLAYLSRVAILVVTWCPESLLEPDIYLNGLASLPLLGVWRLCRDRPRSQAFVSRVEFTGIILAAAVVYWMAVNIPLSARPEQVLTFAMALVMFARAVYVPSSWRLTAWLCAIVGVGLLATTFLLYQTLLADSDSLLGRAGSVQNPSRAAAFVTAIACVWWALASIICATASRVIFGLRKEAADGRRLGQYSLERRLGEGGMGTVYQASHAMLRRPTAVKLLTPEKTSERAIAQFEREVQQTARLTHPNTVTVFDYGRTPDGVFYYAMELIDGATLGDIVDQTGPQCAARTIQILAAATAALSEAHDAGLTHRDIKPANIMLCERGGRHDTVKVLDFGLVKELAKNGAVVTLTSAAVVRGTPQYMPPEAITTPESVDARSDLYAIGAVGYFLITGEHVFAGGSPVEVCGHHLHSTPTPPSQRLGSEVPADLEALLMMCLEKDPSMRPQSSVSFRDALLGCSDVGDWSAEEARKWWTEHGAGLRAAREEVTPSSARTIGVDLGRR